MDGGDKILGALKALPLWMIAGLAIIAIGATLYEPLRLTVPESIRGHLPLVAWALVVLTASGIAAQIGGWYAKRRAARLSEAGLRLEQMYAPLVTLFVRRHITASSAILAPRLKHRLANVWEELHAYQRRPITAARRAWLAIGDRRVSTSAEVEYGGDFPIKDIHDRVVANPVLAGPDLINFVRRADRSQYDGATDGLLTPEEYELFVYIHEEHDRLAEQVRKA